MSHTRVRIPRCTSRAHVVGSDPDVRGAIGCSPERTQRLSFRQGGGQMATKLCAYILAAVLAPALASAGPITILHVAGDSLSDQGNAFSLTGGMFPPPPYDQRASNGPVAVEYLANALGIPLNPSTAAGSNYAVVGAATGAVGNPAPPPLTTENVAAILYGQLSLEGTSLLSQAGDMLLTGPFLDPNALFFVWGGAN